MLRGYIRARSGENSKFEFALSGFRKLAVTVIVIWILVMGVKWLVAEGQSSKTNVANQVQIGPQTQTPAVSKLARIPEKSKLGGVLAGFAYFFGIPLWLLRLLFVLVIILEGDDLAELLILLYILCWIFMPVMGLPIDFFARTGG